MWHHPKYYKELRKRNKSDQAISDSTATAKDSVRPGPGLKPQAASDKQTRTSSGSATSKPQAASYKLRDSRTTVQEN
jgi:hypothetical protein